MGIFDDNIAERYGQYTAQIPGMSVTDEDVRNVDEVYEVFEIAPSSMQQIRKGLGSIMITGVTIKGERVRVLIDPTANLDNVGTLSVGEPPDSYNLKSSQA